MERFNHSEDLFLFSVVVVVVLFCFCFGGSFFFVFFFFFFGGGGELFTFRNTSMEKRRIFSSCTVLVFYEQHLQHFFFLQLERGTICSKKNDQKNCYNKINICQSKLGLDQFGKESFNLMITM